MFRGLIRETRAFPAKEQEAILLAAGVPNKRAIYRDDLTGALASIRADDLLVVAGLYILGKNLAEITDAIEKVHAKGAAVMDAASKHTTAGKYRAILIHEANTALANERRGPRKRTKKDRRMPWDQIAKHYFDKQLSNAELLAIVSKGCSEVSYDTMRRYFKAPRGAIVGRPSARRAVAI